MRVKVSVLMAAYNAEAYLRPAIDSILSQTMADFELIIINDGSVDDTDAIVRSYHYQRIVYHQQANTGLARALNVGLKLARGEYVARMDADDLSLPARLQLQTDYLDAHPDVALVGGSYTVVDGDGQRIELFTALTEPDDVKEEFYVRNPFGHGTVMFKRGVALELGGYDETEAIEDYEFWWRMARDHQVANIPEVIYDWRVIKTSMSHGDSPKRQVAIVKLLERFWGDAAPKLVSRAAMAARLATYRKLDSAEPAARFAEQYLYNQFALGIAMDSRGMRKLSWHRIITAATLARGRLSYLSNLYYFNRSMRGYTLQLTMKPHRFLDRRVAGLLRRVQLNKGNAI